MTDNALLPDPYKVDQVRLTQPIVARPPGSKSLTNRALIMAALCDSEVVLANPLTSEDTEVAKEALQSLGVKISETPDGNWLVDGRGLSPQATPPTLFLGNAGTAMRFLTAVLCAKGIPCTLDGTERMRQRPMHDLIQALQDLGGDVRSLADNGCPPIQIGAGGLRGGHTTMSGQVSSQFFSALMLAAPLAKSDITIHIKDELLSRPYVEMTAQTVQEFGTAATVGADEIHISSSGAYSFSQPSYLIEPDASAATYPLGLAALHGTAAKLDGLGPVSLQGDVEFVSYLAQMGCRIDGDLLTVEMSARGTAPLQPLTVDLKEIPDAAMTLVTLLAVAPGHSTLTGLRNLAFKECDRLTALVTELNSLGCQVRVREDRDGFEIDGVEPASLQATRPLETYKDHRMAMCLAILATIVPGGAEILDPRCVEKTYPTFWQDLQSWVTQGTAKKN